MTFTPYSKTAWVKAGSQPPTRKPSLMKKLALLVAAILPFSQIGCVTTETTAPDGTVTRIKAPAPGSMELIGKGIEVIGSRNVDRSGK